MMAIVETWPPNIEAIRAAFDLAGVQPCFCWGRILYNPHGNPIDDPLLIHETTHSIQQEEGGGPERWWAKYIADPAFRLAQEIPAYHNQLARFHQLHKDRNARERFLHRIASDLSGAMYGRMLPYSEARKRITDGR